MWELPSQGEAETWGKLGKDIGEMLPGWLSKQTAFRKSWGARPAWLRLWDATSMAAWHHIQ